MEKTIKVESFEDFLKFSKSWDFKMELKQIEYHYDDKYKHIASSFKFEDKKI